MYAGPLLDFLNQEDVRFYLNIPTSVQAWDYCTTDIGYRDLAVGSQWIYTRYNSHYRILHYSGDCDGSVPTDGTLRWIEDYVQSLRLSEVEPWFAYYYENQIAGYMIQYEGDFTFATVHGAGHMAPQWKRAETTYLIKSWLMGELPSKVPF